MLLSPFWHDHIKKMPLVVWPPKKPVFMRLSGLLKKRQINYYKKDAIPFRRLVVLGGKENFSFPPLFF